MNLLSYKFSLKFDVTKKKKGDSSYTKRFKSFKSEQIIEIYTTLMTVTREEVFENPNKYKFQRN